MRKIRIVNGKFDGMEFDVKDIYGFKLPVRKKVAMDMSNHNVVDTFESFGIEDNIEICEFDIVGIGEDNVYLARQK